MPTMGGLSSFAPELSPSQQMGSSAAIALAKRLKGSDRINLNDVRQAEQMLRGGTHLDRPGSIGGSFSPDLSTHETMDKVRRYKRGGGPVNQDDIRQMEQQSQSSPDPWGVVRRPVGFTKYAIPTAQKGAYEIAKWIADWYMGRGLKVPEPAKLIDAARTLVGSLQRKGALADVGRSHKGKPGYRTERGASQGMEFGGLYTPPAGKHLDRPGNIGSVNIQPRDVTGKLEPWGDVADTYQKGGGIGMFAHTHPGGTPASIQDIATFGQLPGRMAYPIIETPGKHYLSGKIPQEGTTWVDKLIAQYEKGLGRPITEKEINQLITASPQIQKYQGAVDVHSWPKAPPSGTWGAGSTLPEVQASLRLAEQMPGRLSTADRAEMGLPPVAREAEKMGEQIIKAASKKDPKGVGALSPGRQADMLRRAFQARQAESKPFEKKIDYLYADTEKNMGAFDTMRDVMGMKRLEQQIKAFLKHVEKNK